MRWDAMSSASHPFFHTPNIDRIADEGVRFSNAFVTTSLCSVSRASFLTGTYAHTHGVRGNDRNDPDPAIPTFPRLLRESGYVTGFIGKWHMAPHAGPRPGFDYWLSFRGQGVYLNPTLNENGQEFQASGYVTDLLTDYAVEFLERQQTRPFCLYLSHKAAHANFTPAERHRDAFSQDDLRKPESYEDDLADKPRWMRELRLRGARLKKPMPPDGIPAAAPPKPWDPTSRRNRGRLNWYRTLLAVDESVGRVLETLEASGLAQNTVVILAGDNGLFLGEHGLLDKRLAYEESIRIPLLMRGPGVRGRGRVVPEMVLNIDVAPTIVDLSGAGVPQVMEGRSLRPLLQGRPVEPWRESFLYEYFRQDQFPGFPTIQAIRTPEWKYIRAPDVEDIDELYHLTADEHEMHNLAREPDYQPQLQRLRTELERIADPTATLP